MQKGPPDAQLATLASVPCAWLIAVDRDLRCVLAVGEALADSGLGGDFSGANTALAEVISAERLRRWEPVCNAALRGERSRLDVDGALDRTRRYRIESGPWRDGRSVVGCLMIAHEVSEHRLATESLASELDAFNYSVSHDLRAPLRAIDGFSAAIARRSSDQLDPSSREMLGRIRKAVANMGCLIDALLGLSRLSRRELHRDHVDLTELAYEIVDELRASDADRAVEVAIENGVLVTGDRELLRIVLENLLENAWKFSARREHARIELARDPAFGAQAFVVRDNGAGFDAAAAAGRMFAPFQRLHSDDEFPGLGVGLATVQRIVRRHGGTIRAEGAVGEGASFRVELGDLAEGPR